MEALCVFGREIRVVTQGGVTHALNTLSGTLTVKGGGQIPFYSFPIVTSRGADQRPNPAAEMKGGGPWTIRFRQELKEKRIQEGQNGYM